MSLYLREFPDYDAELPTLNGFVDNSWHNNTCPSLINDKFGLILWCEYADENKRECGGARYVLHRLDDDDNYSSISESDNLADIRKAIEEATL